MRLFATKSSHADWAALMAAILIRVGWIVAILGLASIALQWDGGASCVTPPSP